MTSSTRYAALCLVPVLLTSLACGIGGNKELEGDDAGECSDGADNDVDGDFDCDDADCAGAPECGGDAFSTITGGTSSTTNTNTNTSGGTTGTTGGGTGTVGPYGPVATEIDVITLPGCDGSGDWVYYAETLGWTDSTNTVNAWETGVANGWNEEHTLPTIDFDPSGGWDILERSLTPGVSLSGFSPDVNTLFQCGQQDVTSTMTYAIRVYDLDGAYADCAVFASDPQGVSDLWNGQEPNFTPVSRAAEINQANCLEWNV